MLITDSKFSRFPLRHQIATESKLCDGSKRDSDGIANEIRPKESEPKHQPAESCLANRVDPRCVVELADLYQESESQRNRNSHQDRPTSQQRADQ